MAGTRKNYLLMRRRDGQEAEELRGVFSSMKKARSGVRTDAQALGRSCMEKGAPVLEWDGNAYLLSLPDGSKAGYRIEVTPLDRVLDD